ncbi:MAG: GFA family protein [Gammaproteobacteria bacterium]|nr:GFA family protein [Gammaproteobacteria bacterium]
MSKTYTGECFCGAVKIAANGDPAGMGYCHCADCRHWSAGPINAFTLWPPAQVQITEGAEHIQTYNKTENSYRKWCKKCGGHLFSEHPGLGLTDVYAAILPTLPFAPGLHVFYSEAKVRVHDGLPKCKDMPGEFGGSGETLPE